MVIWRALDSPHREGLHKKNPTNNVLAISRLPFERTCNAFRIVSPADYATGDAPCRKQRPQQIVRSGPGSSTNKGQIARTKWRATAHRQTSATPVPNARCRACLFSLTRSIQSASVCRVDQRRARHLERPAHGRLEPAFRAASICSTFSASIAGGLPPCGRATARPALTRSVVNAHSYSANEPNRLNRNAPCEFVVSIASVRERKATPRTFNSSTIRIR